MSRVTRNAKQRSYYQKNKESVLAYQKDYYERTKPFRSEQSKRHHEKIREEVLKKIAESKGDAVPRCRIDLTPGTPVSDFPCVGKLQIDHMNGGGRKETHSGSNFYRAVRRGDRNLRDLRLLCQLHQLWNTIEVEHA